MTSTAIRPVPGSNFTPHCSRKGGEQIWRVGINCFSVTSWANFPVSARHDDYLRAEGFSTALNLREPHA